MTQRKTRCSPGNTEQRANNDPLISAETSADLVYKVTKTLFENLGAYQEITSKAKAVKLEAACKGLAFPLHEGAKRFYKEAGVKGCDASS